MRFEVCRVSDLPPGARKVVYPIPGPGICVFNINGSFYALKNTCPHMGAPLCFGVLTGTTQPRVTSDGRFQTEWIREGEILKCPWHQWEFEVSTGRTVFPSRNRVATYEVTTESQGEQNQDGVETYPVVVEDLTVYLKLGPR